MSSSSSGGAVAGTAVLTLILVAARCRAQCGCGGSGVVSIEACGAVPMASSVDIARRNGVALACALAEAETEATVVVPYGSRWFVIPNRSFVGLAPNVTLRIDGELTAHDAIWAWPREGRAYLALLSVSNTTGLTVEGRGVVNGQGHNWWWHFARPGSRLRRHKRPILVEIDNSANVTVRDLAFLDAPRFNIYLGSFTRGALVQGVVIIVDWRRQRRILADAAKSRSSLAWSLEYAWIAWFKPSWWSFPPPMFPFNTDGIDVSGRDVVVRDVVVSNWDDVVAVKPSRLARPPEIVPPVENFTWCTHHVRISNVTTLYGGGISVGSVHPSEKLPCVRDVRFGNVTMYSPIKGPYVKPDLAPGYCRWKGNCGALIADVTYENVLMEGGVEPDWWRGFERSQRSRGGAYVEPREPPENWLRLRQSQGMLLATSFDKFVAWLLRPTAASPVCRARWLVNVLCFSWPIYIGTQQQEEPGGVGNGLWPHTEPLCTVANVTLRRIAARGGSWPQSAAVIRCNATNPCTNILLDNVSIRGKFDSKRRWICEAARGDVVDPVDPGVRGCINAPPAAATRTPAQRPIYVACGFLALTIIVVARRANANHHPSSSPDELGENSRRRPPPPASGGYGT